VNSLLQSGPSLGALRTDAMGGGRGGPCTCGALEVPLGSAGEQYGSTGGVYYYSMEGSQASTPCRERREGARTAFGVRYDVSAAGVGVAPAPCKAREQR